MSADSHAISISLEPPSRCCGGALVLGGGHRARCSCGWWSDCYAQLDDTRRAVEVHLRRAGRLDFDELIARSSIGAALADIRARGIDAHLADLERDQLARDQARRWRGRGKVKKRSKTTKKENP